MGRANPVLHIVVEDKWEHEAHIAALREKGHVIYTLTNWACRWASWKTGHPQATQLPPPDLWLLETGHNWNDTDWDYLEAALATARARRRKK